MILTNGVTNANFYSMVEIIFLFTSKFELRDEGDARIERDDGPLQPGNYYITASGKSLCILVCLVAWLVGCLANGS
jgi:hypothetical protein